MSEGAHHHTGETAHTTLSVNENYTLIIFLQSPGDAGINAGGILAMPAGIDPGLLLVLD